MRIYYANKEYKHIVIVPREFKPINDEALEIVSGEIEEAAREAGNFYGPLVLHTPFKDGKGCFIAAQTRKERLLDKLVQREDLYGLLLVELTEAELCMLYSVLYPRQEVDLDAVHAVLLAQADLMKQQNSFGWVEVLHK